jgi:periplasmic protein TonB
VNAEFPGGANGWVNYLSKNLRIPTQLKDSVVTGRIIVRFTITPKGQINNVIIIQGLNSLLDKEVIRVISESPKWRPAEQLGKKVQTTITQPIDF